MVDSTIRIVVMAVTVNMDLRPDSHKVESAANTRVMLEVCSVGMRISGEQKLEG
jgi:hypothetical protein